MNEPSQVDHPDIEQVLIGADQIQERLADIGEQISKDYFGEEIVVAAVLKGAFVLLADLARHLTIDTVFDFMAVTSYGSATQTSGVVRILKDLEVDIADKHVLVVEDIVDSGLTLSYLLRNLRARGPRSLEVMALLCKPEMAQVEIDIRYKGFDVPAAFVVGYGLDYAERYRNLPFIGTLKESVYR